MKKDIKNAIKKQLRNGNGVAALEIANRVKLPLEEFNKLVRAVESELEKKGRLRNRLEEEDRTQ